MSRLKELAATYADEDGNIPVEYYDGTGNIVRGLVQRVNENNVCDIVTSWGSNVIRSKICLDRLAGPGCAQTWCLNRSAQVLYASLTDPKVSQIAEKCMQLLPLLWQNFGNYAEARFALFKEWPGKELSEVIGFIQLSEGLIDRSGYIIYHGEKKPEFVKFLSEKATLVYFE